MPRIAENAVTVRRRDPTKYQRVRLNELKRAAKKLKVFLGRENKYFQEVSKSIIDACGSVEPSWSGSWAGYHAGLYFRNFETPSVDELFDVEWAGAGVFYAGYDPGWQTKTLDETWRYITSKSSTEFEPSEAHNKLAELQRLCGDLKLKLELVNKNSILKKKIRKVTVDFSADDYVEGRSPDSIVSRDSKAIRQGMQVPPHIACMGFGQALRVNQNSATGLLRLAKLVELANEEAEKEGRSELFEVLRISEVNFRKLFRRKPTSEKEVQDRYAAMLNSYDINFLREKGASYSVKTYKPDFALPEIDLAVELKFCNSDKREKELILELNDDIPRYKTKWKQILFVIYDTGHIRDVAGFKGSFETQENVIVQVVKH